MIYKILNKQSGIEVSAFSAANLIELEEYPFAEYDYIEFNPDSPSTESPVLIWDPLEFMRRFTQAERIAIWDASKTSTAIYDFLQLLMAAPSVHSNDPDVIAALTMFEQAGLLTVGRAQEILNG